MRDESTNYSRYVVYADESGDHSLESVDPEYPVFVLAFCIFQKREYVDLVTPSLQEFKFQFFGHDMVVLHEHEIRKARGSFRALIDAPFRDRFMSRLSELVEAAPFVVISAAIQKDRLKKQYPSPKNPYTLALGFCLERLWFFLRSRNEDRRVTHVVFESRGSKEDAELELAFRRTCDGENFQGRRLPFEAIFSHKRTNSCGLQLADLIARPIGRHVLEPTQENRAFSILSQKFDRGASGETKGYGLKIFPA